jgi:hypothetical protein
VEEYNLLEQLAQIGQPMPQGYGVLAPQAPQIEISKKIKQQVPQQQLAQPILAAFQPRQKFPTSADEFNQLIQRQTEGLAGQREGLKQIESQIQELNQPGDNSRLPGILMAASDILSGSKFMQNYQSPEQKEKARKAQALNLQMQMQKAKGDLTDKEIDLFKAQYQDSLGRERLAQEEELARLKIGAETGKTPDLKDWQVQSATYGKRLAQAEDVFNKLGGEGYDRSQTGEGVAAFFQRGPFEQLKGDQLKQQEQAERNFLTATLRKESGASISTGEFATGEKQYFPRAGDTPEVLAQKKANRQQVIEGMKLGAGPAWGMIGTVPGAPAATLAPDKMKRLEELRKKAGK